VPIPWSGGEPPFGFGPGEGQPWLPQPESWSEVSVAAQEADPESTLSFYRLALRTRREVTDGLPDEVTLLDGEPDTLAFVRGGGLVCVLNCGETPVRVPTEAGDLVVASGPLEGNLLPADTAAWFRTADRSTV
jgi:alpha-glucosidase